MTLQAIVLDIEGTVCPISFVKEVLFPYALKKTRQLIPTVNFPVTAPSTPLENHIASFPQEFSQSADQLIAHVEDLTARDVKASYWKSLQGYLWREGYESGEIKAPIYPDAVKNIEQWSKTRKVYIYSSGSVPAQKLLFSYVDGAGDMTKYLSGYFDTVNAGQKTVKESYDNIAREINVAPDNILFLSDNYRETDAAKIAGWNTQLLIRPGNDALPENYAGVHSTDEIVIH